MKAPTCHYDADRGWLSAEDRPCAAQHCGLRGRCAVHVDTKAGIWTCPECIGKVRTDISEVEHLAALMPAEAEIEGVESEAFNLAGPAASPDQLDGRRRYADTERGWCQWPPSTDDAHHPYAVLGRWDLALREEYGPATDLFVTVSRAADYLRALLAGGFPHTRAFEEFSRDVARCRAHLETVAHDSRRPELGARCPRCEATCEPADKDNIPRLRRRYARHPRLRRGEVCDLVKCRTCDGLDDTWHCPDDPAHWWAHGDYVETVDVAHRENVKEGRWLTAAEVSTRYTVKPATLRKWASRNRVKSRWIGEQLRYDTTDVRAVLESDGVAVSL